MKKIILILTLVMATLSFCFSGTNYRDMKKHSTNSSKTYYAFQGDKFIGYTEPSWEIREYSSYISSDTIRYVIGVGSTTFNSAWNRRETISYYTPQDKSKNVYTSTN